MADQEELVQQLFSLGTGKSLAQIRDLLQKHNWNPDAAAGALFDPSNDNDPIQIMEPNERRGRSDRTDDRMHIDGDEGKSTAVSLHPTSSSTNLNVIEGSWSGGRSILHIEDRRPSSGVRGVLNSPASDTRIQGPKNKDAEVIDLTGDEDPDLAKAMRESLETSGIGQFQASDRAPSADWAMVPSNVPAGSSISQEEQAMSRAVEESLKASYIEDIYDEPPADEQVRKGHRPLALRTSATSLQHACLLLQALVFVPQVTYMLKSHKWPEEHDPYDGKEPNCHSDAYHVYILQAILALQDLGQMSYSEVPMDSFQIDPWNPMGTKGPGFSTEAFYARLALAAENMLFGSMPFETSSWPRLFHFRQGYIGTPPTYNPFSAQEDHCVVSVEFNPSSLGHPTASQPLLQADLVSLLTAQYCRPPPSGSNEIDRRVVISETSEIVAFNVVRNTPAPSNANASSSSTSTVQVVEGNVALTFPTSIYLDRFLERCKDITNAKALEKERLVSEVEALAARKKDLSLDEKGQDVLKSLRSSAYYFENLAAGGLKKEDDENKKLKYVDAGKKLRQIIQHVEDTVNQLDVAIAKLNENIASVYDSPHLMNDRYDLRAVLYQDGFYGRTHAYSYVQDFATGAWWKTVDHNVTQVSEETVLTDTTGLHLGGGPYFLIYSRALDQSPLHASSIEGGPMEWDLKIKNTIKGENQSFRAKLSPGLATELEALESPMGSSSASPQSQSVPLPVHQITATVTRMDIS
ncbi:hypothetical protein SISNIDRAFT_482586 [Sistotremastrum niveocremeum HHB9708]|uniref:UBA domain-containing protein n=1 Tax=Sistotremastrum niveocremeum HHB9708 TaxID=1314777 RepID=A0A164YCL9_9AGAM|nr:hypothetical protein SISNIDRAFT_482586 [Sistotremastrum niveocremeum HHB9708]